MYWRLLDSDAFYFYHKITFFFIIYLDLWFMSRYSRAHYAQRVRPCNCHVEIKNIFYKNIVFGVMVLCVGYCVCITVGYCITLIHNFKSRCVLWGYCYCMEVHVLVCKILFFKICFLPCVIIRGRLLIN